MPTVNISLPDSMRKFLDGQVADGHYSSVSEYVRMLIREDERRKERDRVEALLLEGLGSEAGTMTKRDWAEIRRQGLARIRARKPTRSSYGRTNYHARQRQARSA